MTDAKVTAERDALKAEVAKLQDANQKLAKWNKVADEDRTKWANETARLRLEAAENKVYVDRLCVEGDALQAHLTELREAVSAYINAEDDDRDDEFAAMEAVLAKVKP